jgi:hypothetical protein
LDPEGHLRLMIDEYELAIGRGEDIELAIGGHGSSPFLQHRFVGTRASVAIESALVLDLCAVLVVNALLA